VNEDEQAFQRRLNTFVDNKGFPAYHGTPKSIRMKPVWTLRLLTRQCHQHGGIKLLNDRGAQQVLLSDNPLSRHQHRHLHFPHDFWGTSSPPFISKQKWLRWWLVLSLLSTPLPVAAG
jgi:hypothetical protein